MLCSWAYSPMNQAYASRDEIGISQFERDF